MRKNILCLLVACLICSLASAQIAPGKFVISADSELGWLFGSRNFEIFDPSTGTIEQTRVRSFNIASQVGYFVLEGLALGLDFQVTTSNEQRRDSNIDGRTLLAGPFARYYFSGENVRVFTGLGARTGLRSYDWIGDNFESNFESEINQVTAESGLTFFIKERIAIDGTLLILYEYQNAKNSFKDRGSEDRIDNEGSIWEWGLTVGFSFFL